ncbi:MAG: PstS family phosphate ABC transporter substrate-binding protein [Myxococcales bacterium]|nr:PstS family phosphate ABC transporter substrate-binding protein [Myxococcales bacterium]
MSKRFIALGILAVLAVGLCLFVACQPAANQPADQTAAKPAEPAGTVRVSGAWALYPMMVRWAEEYNKVHPNIRIDVSAGGAGKGAADALAKLVDIGMVSRAIKAEETAQGAFFVPVVKDAVFPTINSANPLVAKGLAEKGIKRQVFVDLYINKKELTWGDVIGVPVKDKVQVYTRSDSCGAAETWALYLGAKAQEALQGIGVYGDPGVAEAVRRDPMGLGFNNLNFAFDPKTGEPLPGIMVPPIDINENGKVDPEEMLSPKANAIKAVVSGVYPSPPARDLNLMTKDKFEGAAKDFVRWILTDGQKFVDEVGYIKLTDQSLADNLTKIGQ